MATEAEALEGLWTWSTHLRGNSTGTADVRKQKTGRLAAQHDEHRESESPSCCCGKQLGLVP